MKLKILLENCRPLTKCNQNPIFLSIKHKPLIYRWKISFLIDFSNEKINSSKWLDYMGVFHGTIQIYLTELLSRCETKKTTLFLLISLRYLIRLKRKLWMEIRVQIEKKYQKFKSSISISSHNKSTINENFHFSISILKQSKFQMVKWKVWPRIKTVCIRDFVYFSNFISTWLFLFSLCILIDRF